MKKTIKSLALLAGSIFLINTANADIVVVGPSHMQLNELTTSEVRQLFFGTSSSTGASELVPVDLSSDSQERARFYQEVMGKSSAEMQAYWARMTFTGRAKPPKLVLGRHALRVLLQSSHKEIYIGYLDEKDVTADMKILYRRQP